MTKARILELVAKETKYKACCSSVAGVQYADDLYQHLYVMFAEMPAKKIEAVWNTGGFFSYYSVVAYRNYNSYHSSFYKKYKHIGYNTTELPDIPEQHEEAFTVKIDLLDEVLNDYDHEDEVASFEARLFKDYLEAGSCRKLAAQTGISYRTIADNIDKYKQKIRRKFEEASNNIK